LVRSTDQTREEREAVDAAAGEEAPETGVDAALDAYFEAGWNCPRAAHAVMSLLELGSLKTVRPPGAVSRKRLEAIYFADQPRAGERLHYWRCHESDFACPAV
jgi:hypothetical protein